MRRFLFILFMVPTVALAGQTFQFYSTDVRPTTDLQLDVGTSAKRFNNVYCSNVSTSTMVTTGNVGIGSATPSQRLDVNGTSRTGQLIDTGLTASKVVFTDASKQLTSTGIGTSAQFIKGDGSLDSSTYQSTNSQWTTSGTNLYMTLAGNVGLGSSAPRQKLDIEGSVYIGASGNIGIGSASPQQRLDVEGSIYVGSAGNLGIGTTASRQMLDVEGAVYMKGNVGISTSAPEYPLTIRVSGPLMSRKTGANTACTTTCGTAGCYFGENTDILGTMTDCADATADVCFCAGS